MTEPANMPCPFCGTPDTTVTHGENSLGTYRQVTCNECGAFGPRTLGSGSEDEARRRWDRRTVAVNAVAATSTTYEETLSLAKALFAAFSEGFTSDTMTWDQQGRRQRAWLRVADRARRLLVSEDAVAAPPGRTVGVVHACRADEDVSLCGVRTKAPDWMTSNPIITESGLGSDSDNFPCPACWVYGRKGNWVQRRPEAAGGPLSDRLHQLVASMESLAKQVRALQQTTPTIAAFDAQRATYEMSDKINADVMQEFKDRLDRFERHSVTTQSHDNTITRMDALDEDLKFVRSNHGSCIVAVERDATESRAMIAALRGDYMKLASRLDALDHPAAGILQTVGALAHQGRQLKVEVERLAKLAADDRIAIVTKVARHQEWLEAIQRDLPKFARDDLFQALCGAVAKLETLPEEVKDLRNTGVMDVQLEELAKEVCRIGDREYERWNDTVKRLKALERQAQRVIHASTGAGHGKAALCGADVNGERYYVTTAIVLGPRFDPEHETPCDACWLPVDGQGHRARRDAERDPRTIVVHAGVDRNDSRRTACGRTPAPADEVSGPELRGMGVSKGELACPACWMLDPTVDYPTWIRRTGALPMRNGELDENMLARVLWKAQYDLYPGSTFPEFEDAGSEKQRPFYAYASAVNRLYRGGRR